MYDVIEVQAKISTEGDGYGDAVALCLADAALK